MKRLLIIWVVIFCVNNQLLAQNPVEISGIVKNNQYKTIQLVNILNDTEITNSEISQQGKFNISANITESNFYKLRLTKETYILLILKPGEKIQIEIDVRNINKPKIKGSTELEEFYTMFEKNNFFNAEIDSAQARIKKQKLIFLREKMLKTPSSLGNLLFLKEFDIQADNEFYRTILEAQKKEHPNNQIVLELLQSFNESSKLSIGSQAPEFELPTPQGNLLKLSSLQGKIVLIDFWASWCGPCRAEIPNLVSLYKKYKEKGFEILGVSLDKDKEAWIKTIQKETMNWLHVSDLKFWNSAVVPIYNIKGIPQTILLDKNGKIIAKDLRGEYLNAKLSEIFK